jgi:hypothetical protein
MTSKEFAQWWGDLTIRWPSVTAWLAKSFPDESQQRALLRTWSECMNDVSLESCLEINRQMQTGDLAWVGEYDSDKERLPQHVRRLARQHAWDRRSKPQEPTPDRINPTSFPAAKILLRIRELTDAGTPRDEAKRIALEEFPVGKPKYAPRYHCLICEDVGMVIVASRTAMEYMLADKFHECHHRDAAIVCSCKGHLPVNPKRQHLIYDPAKDFKSDDSLWPQEQVDRFREWVEAKRDEYWNSKRDPAFDAFNQRAFA